MPPARHQDPQAIVGSLACLPSSVDDEIWLVSSRSANPKCVDLAELECRRFAAGTFPTAALPDLIAAHHAEPAKKTIVYIHGNRTNLCWSMARGLQVFARLFETCDPHPPVRYVIWSWPADPHPRRLQEYHENSQRSMDEGRILAAFLQQLNGPQPVGLIGYSLGVQTLVSGMEQQMIGAPVDLPRCDVVAIAPALQRPWVDAENPFAGAGELPLQITHLDNDRDRALRFHRVAVRHLPPGCSTLGIVRDEAQAVVDPWQFDVGSQVGRQHNIVRYLEPETIRTIVRDTVLGTHVVAASLTASPPAGSQPVETAHE